VYEDRIEDIQTYLSTICNRQAVVKHLHHENREELLSLMQTLQEEGRIEMLTLVSPTGEARLRAHNPDSRGDSLVANPIIKLALQREKPISGTVILPRETLLNEGEAFAERARFPIRFTPGQRNTRKKETTEGMAIGAAIPLHDEQTGALVGLLYGAVLLDRRYEFVDTIRNEVFLNKKYEGKPIGTATIFQDDLRISTNVRNEDGTRAVGTVVSEEVYRAVVDEGTIWSDRAFVVNEWLITAYEPIRNPYDEVIGMLYVGLLEKPYLQANDVIVVGFLMVVILTTIATLVLLYFSTRMILQPIGKILSMSGKVQQGDLSARVKIRPPGEMGMLCQAIDQMADAVSQREQQLKEVTQQQIGQSEKLASIGRLAAGIAHEINNPLTGILTFAHLLKDKQNMTKEDQEDIGVIVRETTRVREIVRGLLDFARESVSEQTILHLNEVVEQSLKLLENQKEFRQIAIQRNLEADLPSMRGDRNQLQQVLLNLALNACEAMPEGGHLRVTTAREANRILLRVEDTGQGIPAESLEKIFDPFFTTKPVGKGTGLGLSVSYGIVQTHRGSIEVESRVGEGTIFMLTFPIAPPSEEKESAESVS
ncbi:HAMP domain-containing protein, partial [bacterium]|nr:HAMP domain-containing protein [bacterium]